ncbi:MAG: sugar nucleotide-binding protein [Verrucomicrobiota bacterium]|nr:sugar nucleotide-binding protein [Verrucomicrobiota bacterium]
MADWLIVGVDSKIGNEISKRLKSRGKQVLGTSRITTEIRQPDVSHLDLRQDPANCEIPAGIKFAIFCASVTNVRECRLNPVLSNQVNITNTITLLKRLVDRHIHVVFPSSTLVFDGNTPYQKTSDPTNPITLYGKQKATIEEMLGDLPNHSIVRLAKVLGRRNPLFQSWSSNLRESKPVHPFSDLKVSPISLDFAAEFIISIAENHYCGTFHVGGSTDLSYLDISLRIASEMGLNRTLIKPKMAAESGIPQNEIPNHTTLDTMASYKQVGMKPPDIWEVILDAARE